jgi:putative transposase
MNSDPHKHHRHSIRLPGYDYTQAGAYFVTIVTHQRACLFGEIVDGAMRLNSAGKIAAQEWQRLPQHFPNLQIGAYIIMPNHIHGILILSTATTSPTNTSIAPTDNRVASPNGPAPGSLGAILGQFKSRLTRRLRAQPGLPRTPVWQRNYYEHILRNDSDRQHIQQYIDLNPSRWASDEENPARQR